MIWDLFTIKMLVFVWMSVKSVGGKWWNLWWVEWNKERKRVWRSWRISKTKYWVTHRWRNNFSNQRSQIFISMAFRKIKTFEDFSSNLIINTNYRLFYQFEYDLSIVKDKNHLTLELELISMKFMCIHVRYYWL